MAGFNDTVIEDFRTHGGHAGGYFEGAPLLLLHSKGAKSGEARISPMMYLGDEAVWYVFASKGGAPESPGWYHNLVAHPEEVSIEVGDGENIETVPVRARALEGEERATIYGRQAALYPQFAEYATKTTRLIPVVALTRR